MKKVVMMVACVFALSLIVPGLNALTGSMASLANAQDIRSETKKQQDDAYKKGKARSQGYKKGKGGKPSDDGYKDMDDTQREAYKKGYKAGQ